MLPQSKLDALVARYGRENWGDERKWLTVRLPIASANLPHLAAEGMRFDRAYWTGENYALALDGDGTRDLSSCGGRTRTQPV